MLYNKECFVDGKVELLEAKRIIAIIGSREITQAQHDLIVEFMDRETKLDPTVVYITGGATGADAACMFNAEMENLILSLPSIGQLYPREHESAYYTVIENGGLIISPNKGEFDKAAFHDRNSIIVDYATELYYVGDTPGTMSTVNKAKAKGIKVVNLIDTLTRKERKAKGLIESTGIDYSKGPDENGLRRDIVIRDGERKCYYAKNCGSCKMAHCVKDDEVEYRAYENQKYLFETNQLKRIG